MINSKQTAMIKRMTAVLIYAAVILLSACSNGERSDKADISQTADTAASEEISVPDETTSADSSAEQESEDMPWTLFDEFYPETDKSDTICRNYAHNSQIAVSGYIDYGQANPPVCDYRLSQHSFADVGCEVIAAYNFLESCGESPDLARLAAEFEYNALIASDGSLGSMPRKIGGLFKAMDIGYEKILSFDDCGSAFREGKPLILSFHTGGNVFSGIHTVFVSCENGRHYVYNMYNYSSGKTEINSLEELVEQKQLFIVAFTTAEK